MRAVLSRAPAFFTSQDIYNYYLELAVQDNNHIYDLMIYMSYIWLNEKWTLDNTYLLGMVKTG